MRINMSIMYGVNAACCVAQNCNDGPVLAGRIQKEHDISPMYLYKILGQLVRANILRSKKGPKGGFTLARPAGEISLLEIWEAIDGLLRSDLELAQLTKNQPFSIKMEELCNQATDKARSVLAKAKLSSIIR